MAQAVDSCMATQKEVDPINHETPLVSEQSPFWGCVVPLMDKAPFHLKGTGWYGTLKRVVCYFEDGGVVL